ncbi:MAG: acyl-CoA thioesterase [Microbacteriaceae bacterium]|nr:acyl-CoA thioesterase [Microbacteriaceae bacterium]
MTASDCFVSGEVDGERRFHVPIHVRWRDLDAYGHVNNATLFTLLEEARIAAFWRDPSGELDPARPLAVVGATGEVDTITLIAGHQIEYLAPIEHGGGPLDVQMWVSRLGAASAEVSYDICSPHGQRPHVRYASARSAIVFVDRASNRPRRITDDERAAWAPFVGPARPMRADRRDA